MALHVVEQCASAVAARAVALLLVIRLLLRLSELSVPGGSLGTPLKKS